MVLFAGRVDLFRVVRIGVVCIAVLDWTFHYNDANIKNIKLHREFDVMEKQQDHFWVTKTLDEMTKEEWESWHYLVSGDPYKVHQEGISVRDKVVSGKCVHPSDLNDS